MVLILRSRCFVEGGGYSSDGQGGDYRVRRLLGKSSLGCGKMLLCWQDPFVTRSSPHSSQNELRRVVGGYRIGGDHSTWSRGKGSR